jgi:hypothetical protein
MTTADRRCAAKTRSGAPCKARALPGKRHCLFHSRDPADRRTRERARREGGRRRSRQAAVLAPTAGDLPLARVADVVGLLGQTINQVRKGQLDVKVANCVGYLGGVLLKALEGGELAREVEELRRLVEELQHERPGDAAATGTGAAGAAGPEGAELARAGAAACRPGGDPDGGGPGGGPVAGRVPAVAGAADVAPLFPAGG